MAAAVAVIQTVQCGLEIASTRAAVRAVLKEEPDGPRLAHLALTSCAHCYGLGHVCGKRGAWTVCSCAHRTMFRQCMTKYHVLGMEIDGLRASVRMNRRRTFSMPGVEYRADLWLIAKRTLDVREWQVFVLHKVQGHDWKMCCRAMKCDRGTFFHSVYRLEAQMGKALMQCGLWPVYGYFSAPKGEWHGGGSKWGWQAGPDSRHVLA